MASGTLYTYPENTRAYKALIAAQYSGAHVTVPEFVFGKDNKEEWFQQKFPFGKVPVFKDTDGNAIIESNAIAYYTANDQLKGKTPLEQAQVLQWMSFSDCELSPATATWIYPVLGYIQFNKQATDRAKEDVKRAFGFLNKVLLRQTYLVGERISLADIIVSCSCMHLYQHVLDPTFRADFPNVNRWFTTLINQPQFKAVIGEFKMCTKMEEFSQKKFQEVQAKMGNLIVSTEPKGKGGAGGREKKKSESDQKGGKKAPAAKEDDHEEMDATEEALAQEPKAKDPFEQFPKGNFVMDDFKRVYSNEETTKSIPYFMEKFDPENYSIWYCEYKYSSELSQVFMSCNLITGMFQRLDKMRKNAFGSVCLFGENNNSTISGLWFWRGPELAFTLSPDWQIDYESYTWKKLDFKDPATKDLVHKYFAWEGKDSEGRPFNQGKIFK